MEPEPLIPISVVPLPRECDEGQYGPPPLVVMAGDEHQLGPRTALPHTPLKTSLFARLSQSPAEADHPLSGSGRQSLPPLSKSMLPILRPAFDTLIPKLPPPFCHPTASTLTRWSLPRAPRKQIGSLHRTAGGDATGRYCFHANFSRDERGLKEGGWCNVHEASSACNYARSLVSIGLVEQDELCIMSSFKAQIRLLRQTMQLSKFSMRDVNIGLTDSFQGLEKGVVLLYTTRSETEFVADNVERGWGIIHRLSQTNVALTRAKSGLIIIGRKKVLHMDENWRAVLAFCDRNGLAAGDDNDDEAADGDARTWTSAESDTNYDA